MCVLSCTNLSAFRSDRSAVLSNLTFTFPIGITGLVGANGAGKTTLLRLLAGISRPETGQVLTSGRVALQHQINIPAQRVVDVFDVGAGYDLLRGVLTGTDFPDDMEEVDWTLDERVRSSCSTLGLQIEPDQQIASLSGGQRIRLSLAACLFQEPDILLLDEPTNNLDAEGIGFVRQVLGAFEGIVVMASHDRQLLEMADGILALQGGHCRFVGGNYTAFQAEERARRARATAAMADAKKAIHTAKQEAAKADMRRARAARLGKQKRTCGSQPKIAMDAKADKATSAMSRAAKEQMQRSEIAHKSLDQAAADMPRDLDVDMALSAVSLAAQKTIASCTRLSLSLGQKSVLRDISFTLHGPERMAIKAANGAGKTQLLRCLMGLQLPSQGEAKIHVPYAYLDQESAGLAGDETLLQAYERQHPTAEHNLCHAALARFGFRADAAHRFAHALSGGERMRAALSIALAGPTPPELLILDEPTNHLDLIALSEIESVLRAYRGAVLVVSHDETFLKEIGITKVLRLHPDHKKGSANSIELPDGSRI